MNTLRSIGAALALAFACRLTAQLPCPDFGGVPTAARLVDAPFTFACHGTNVPAWRLFTPPHRAPGARPGRTPGEARQLPRLLVTYRCTGLWWLPVAPDRVRIMGYVVDQPDHACAISP